ncbi:LysR family transcriptional regulator [Castellaniella defragrans]|jgi:DNA-binding transcriptional LysR family regulator|uniref:Transcriptional regulator, LysR-family n=2 Tax=Castellaniella defragrans TaxID=75697 RepID=W8X184_CASD6|nr:LysR family transcriptional regulator [Castellaniella defragrans]KAB0622153.1 LysR family transcriptional regulator [Castellaniella defragrans]MBB6084575.1 DNA-binding transcriptional LysR family regulator [Castellaniella defragrans]CDM25853.1 transcriptional regulator, LysR-family [Castellaniella defragrans 65Phen]
MDCLDRPIRYFLKIAELSSLSRAAEDLGLSQSGLSRKLASLEAHLGKPLFLRTGRGMELTEAGRKLAEAALPAYTAIDDMLVQLRDREGLTQGNLSIAIIHTVGYYFVSDLLSRFVGKHSQVNLTVLARSSPEVVELVEKGKADIGLVYDSAVASDRLESTPLLMDEMCLIARAQDLPDQVSVDLARSSLMLVGFPENYALRRMLKSAGLDERVTVVAETVDAMLQLSATGIGACVLPANIPAPLLRDYGLVKVPLQAPGLQRLVVAIVRHDIAAGSLARQLLNMAKAISTMA